MFETLPAHAKRIEWDSISSSIPYGGVLLDRRDRCVVVVTNGPHRLVLPYEFVLRVAAEIEADQVGR